MENLVYVLNPDYVFKNDNKRILVYSKGKCSDENTKPWFSMIHPVQAMIFSFFSHERLFGENIRMISSFLNITYDAAKKMILPFVENEKPLKTTHEGVSFALPGRLIVNKKNIDRHENKSFDPEDMWCGDADFSTQRLYECPIHMTIMLTNRCVTKCKYCYADTQTNVDRHLSTEKIFDLIREAHRLKMKNIHLIGGEVLLHKDWDIILKKLVEYDFYPDVISTKVPVTERIVNKFKNAGFTRKIQISLDSVSPAILKNLLCVDSSYADKVKEGILLLDRNQFSYQVATILTRYNDSPQSIYELFTFLKTLKHLKIWRITPAMNSLYKNYADFSKIKTDKERLNQLYSFIEKEIRPYAGFDIILDKEYINKQFYATKGGSASFKGAGCSALNDHMFVLPDGRVTICEQLYWNPNFIIGDVNDNSICEIWNSPRAATLADMKRSDIQKRSKCNTCRQFQECFDRRNRCWADIIKAYGDENWDFPDPRCSKAPKMTYNLAF